MSRLIFGFSTLAGAVLLATSGAAQSSSATTCSSVNSDVSFGGSTTIPNVTARDGDLISGTVTTTPFGRVEVFFGPGETSGNADASGNFNYAITVSLADDSDEITGDIFIITNSSGSTATASCTESTRGDDDGDGDQGSNTDTPANSADEAVATYEEWRDGGHSAFQARITTPPQHTYQLSYFGAQVIASSGGRSFVARDDGFSFDLGHAVPFESWQIGEHAARLSFGEEPAQPFVKSSLWTSGDYTVFEDDDGDFEGSLFSVTVGGHYAFQPTRYVAGTLTYSTGEDSTAGGVSNDFDGVTVDVGYASLSPLQVWMMPYLRSSTQSNSAVFDNAGTEVTGEFDYSGTAIGFNIWGTTPLYGGQTSAWDRYIISEFDVVYAQTTAEAHTLSDGTQIAEEAESIGQITFGPTAFWEMEDVNDRLDTVTYFAGLRGHWRFDGADDSDDEWRATVSGGARYGFENGTNIAFIGSVGGIGSDQQNASLNLTFNMPTR